MDKRASKSLVVKILLATIAIFYFIFLYIDFFRIDTLVSSDTIKFSSIVLVFSICLMIGKDSIASKDRFLLTLGLLLTLVADIFLLLLDDHYIFGVGLFSIVQILYSIRYKAGHTKAILVSFSLLFIALLFSYIIVDSFLIEVDFLLVISLYYAICLLSSTKKAIDLYKRGPFPQLNSKILALAMVLFLLCDINVALSNIVRSIAISNSFTRSLAGVSSVSMWLFYLPSQVLLSLSGYREPYLKSLFAKK